MEEYIDMVTASGKPTGKTALKSVIHQEGYYHNTAHLWLYTPTGEVLLAQRSLSKAICPGLWDVSVAGHVDAGEGIAQAALRETREEIGLELQETDLDKLGVFPCFQSYENGIQDNEFHHTFVAQLPVALSQLRPEPQEVAALKLVPLDTCWELLKQSDHNQHFVASNSAYYETVWQAIANRLP